MRSFGTWPRQTKFLIVRKHENAAQLKSRTITHRRVQFCCMGLIPVSRGLGQKQTYRPRYQGSGSKRRI